jgi:hypothetical protein
VGACSVGSPTGLDRPRQGPFKFPIAGATTVVLFEEPPGQQVSAAYGPQSWIYKQLSREQQWARLFELDAVVRLLGHGSAHPEACQVHQPLLDPILTVWSIGV